MAVRSRPFVEKVKAPLGFRAKGRAVIEGGEGCPVLITGDKALLDLGRAENLEILGPRQFWEKLKIQQKR